MQTGKMHKCLILCSAVGLLFSAAALPWVGARACGTNAAGAALPVFCGERESDAMHSAVQFSEKNPGTIKPVLTWEKVSGAVAYELELLKEAPEDAGIPAPAPQVFFTTRQVYVNGYNADLSALEQNEVYWRVRGLDIEGNPIGNFSAPEKIPVDRDKVFVQSPVPTSIFNETAGAALLYPVYAWIPVHGAETYEVEILDALPENPRGVEPSRHRIDVMTATGFDCYDDVPRISKKTLYWRVRALARDGSPLGVYSEAAAFNIDLRQHVPVATYGDSITHGGGSISYSPADWEYSYQHYLDFPTINLGRSGDTSATMVERFEQDVLPFQPQYLLILAGTNSLRGSATAKSVMDDLMILQAKCMAHHIQPIFLTIPPIHPDNIKRAFNQSTAPDWQEKIWLVNQFIRRQTHIEIARNMVYDGGVLPETLAVDGLHPDAAGKQKMAAAIHAQWGNIIGESGVHLQRWK